ncbi:MAG: hypothetical protein ABIS07_17375 [Dokdonella sp.]
MSKQTWSINGLATELDMDRRTLARRLESLPAAERKESGGRTEKRWHMADVLAHLKSAGTDSTIESNPKTLAFLKEWLGETVVPGLVDGQTFRNLVLGYARQDLKLTKPQAMDLLGVVTLAIVRQVCVGMGDEAMPFAIEESPLARWSEAKTKGTAAAFLREYWPDAKSKAIAHG